MSQKFIQSGEKTTKKVGYYQQERPKKFSRKRSERDRSFDSKRSRDDSASQYIKNVANNNPLKLSQIHNEAFSFIERFDKSLILDLDGERRPRNSMYNRTNTNRQRDNDDKTSKIRIEMLQTQVRVKEGECERFRLHLDEQKEKRRKVEGEKRNIIKQMHEVEKLNERLNIQNKKLAKEKQYLIKQVEFLEKINYDEKTRIQQSFRQKHMLSQIEKLREELKTKKSQKERLLQQEMEQIGHQKMVAEEKFKSMKSLVEVLRGKIENMKIQIFEEKEMSRQKIIGSVEYVELKERYRRFIQTYKEIRAQNWNLRNLLEGRQTSFALSDSDPQTYI